MKKDREIVDKKTEKDKSTNLSKRKREHLLDVCSRIKNKETVDVTEIAELEQFIKSMKYGLNFEQHEEPVDRMLKTHVPIFKEFKEVINNPESADCNFLLEGDNLHSLKLLEKTHKGRIDVCYLDPPYNTLNEDFVYGDKMLDENDGFKHSKWLSFMKERLQIARKLLADDGVIFISIDDREQAQLKLLCDEIFGAENFVCSFIWKKNNDAVRKNISKILVLNEYIICYQKSKLFRGFLDKAKMPESMSNPDKDIRGDWFNANISSPVKKGNEKNVFSVKINGFEVQRRWFYDKIQIQKWVDEDKIYLPIKNGSPGTPRLKMFEADFKDKTKTANNFILDCNTTDGRENLENVFKTSNLFSYPKPVFLLKKLIDYFQNKNCLVLDFFAGSGTTGQAVLDLNKEDGGNRHFILCTNNEVSTSKHLNYIHSKGYMNDVKTCGKSTQSKINKFFEDNPDVYKKLMVDGKGDYESYGICQSVTFPRLNTIITGIRPDGTKYSDGIETNLRYFQTEMVDKNDEDLDDLLLDASLCLAELDCMSIIDDKTVCVAECDEDVEDIIDNATDELKVVFVADDVFFEDDEQEFFDRHNVTIKPIPDCYYRKV